MTAAARIAALLAAAFAVAAGARPAAADGFLAHYSAFWAGLKAADIRLEAEGAEGGYRDAIAIDSKGLSRLLTHFRSRASSEGRFVADRVAEPSRYDSLYDLHNRRDRRISMLFVTQGGAVTAERGPGDTSRKPPLAEKFRRNVVDPLSALERIRGALRRRPETAFIVPVYDGARRFDMVGRLLPAKDGLLHVELTLRPIAGFKGEASEDGDPDDAPRIVQLAVTDDDRLMPVSLSVPVWYLPLVVRLDYSCAVEGARLRPLIASDADNARRNCRR